MRSNVSDVLPPAVKRSLTKFGSDLATARRKRGLTILAVSERMGVAKNTYLRAEKGDPKVGLGVYAMALFVLGFGGRLDHSHFPEYRESSIPLCFPLLPSHS